MIITSILAPCPGQFCPWKLYHALTVRQPIFQKSYFAHCISYQHNYLITGNTCGRTLFAQVPFH